MVRAASCLLYHLITKTELIKWKVLNNGDVPLAKSRYMKYINNEEHPYGENVIVAIMCIVVIMLKILFYLMKVL